MDIHTHRVPIYQEHKVDPDKKRIMYVEHDSWQCKDCQPVLRNKWWWHMLECTDSEPDIYLKLVDKSEWGSVRKWISRHDGDYFRLKMINGNLVVLSNRPISMNSIPHDNREEVFRNLLEMADTRIKRPNSASDGWTLAGEHKKRPESEWRKISPLDIPISEIEPLLDRFNILPEPIYENIDCSTLIITASKKHIRVPDRGLDKVGLQFSLRDLTPDQKLQFEKELQIRYVWYP